MAEIAGKPTEGERARYPILPAYDHCLKCSNLFNLMDASGVISTTERAALMQRVRTLACRAAAAYLEQNGRGPEAGCAHECQAPKGNSDRKPSSKTLNVGAPRFRPRSPVGATLCPLPRFLYWPTFRSALRRFAAPPRWPV